MGQSVLITQTVNWLRSKKAQFYVINEKKGGEDSIRT